MRARRAWLMVLLGLGAAGAATETRPAADAFVRREIDTLADTLHQGGADRFEKVRARIEAVADFPGFAEAALGSRWQSMSVKERESFQRALQHLLESHYMNRPASIFDKKKIAIDGVRTAGELTIVDAKVRRKDVDILVEVKLRPEGPSWRVEDVVIDELSLLEDYRAQLRILLKKKSLAEVVLRLEKKAKENLAPAR